MDIIDKHIVAIDLGTSKIAITVAKVNGNDVQIIYYKETASAGIRYSSVFNVKQVTDVLQRAIMNAEGELGIKITQAVVGMPKYPVRQETSNGEIRDRGEFTSTPVTIYKEYKSKDGTIKFLFKLADDNIVEGVLMQYKYGNTICISTQVGCRMGCVFCASGIAGRVRNLSAGEMMGQVLVVNKYLGGGLKDERKITNIVLMGSGEPLDNYDNVIKFIRLISSNEGINISQRNISLSTCGIAPKIKSLADEDLGITLTISLHATTDENRRKIMNIANAYSLADLIESIQYYYKKTKRGVVFEYILSRGNVSAADARRIASLTKGVMTHINMIPINRTPTSPLVPANKEKVTEFFEGLKQAGISATTRRTLGADIDGACGQLRRRVLSEETNN